MREMDERDGRERWKGENERERDKSDGRERWKRERWKRERWKVVVFAAVESGYV